MAFCVYNQNMENEVDNLLAILGQPRSLVFLDIGQPNDEERAMFQARLDAINSPGTTKPAEPCNPTLRRCLRC